MPPPTRTLLPTLGDAAFLACSWTWCIGMFLPVLLLRDLGRDSWFVFAIPNILGAAAMAWWFKDAHRSHAFVTRHHTAIRWFSLVTLAFQWFFAAWLLRGVGLSLNSLLLIAGFIAIFFLVPTPLTRDSRRHVASLTVLVASAGLIAAWAILHPDQTKITNLPAPILPREHLLPLAAVCTLGFLTCPLLDATFHTTLQRTPRPKLAFALGFVLLFAGMIAATLHYGAALVLDASTTKRLIAPAGTHWLVLGHIAIQLAFTIAVHERTLRHNAPAAETLPTDPGTFGASLTGLLLGLLPGMFPLYTKDFSNHELVYRVFMSAYALIFPLYVLACALPLGRHAAGLTTARLAAMAVTAAIAVPFFWEGFIARKTPWLYAGIAIVLAGGLLTRALTKGPHGPTAPSPEPSPLP